MYKIGIIGLGEISTVYINHLKQYPQYLQLYGCAQLPGAGRSVRSKEMAEAVYWFRHDNRRVLTGGEEEI